MSEQPSTGQEFARGTGRVIGHAVAIVIGLALMVAGVAMGVTILLLPLGIPLGLVGLGIFIWGLFGWARAEKTPVTDESLRQT
jgi:hypothetical protein